MSYIASLFAQFMKLIESQSYLFNLIYFNGFYLANVKVPFHADVWRSFLASTLRDYSWVTRKAATSNLTSIVSFVSKIFRTKQQQDLTLKLRKFSFFF